MKVVADPDELSLEAPVVSIGNFDGVHWGHRQLLARMSGLAADLGRPAAVVTFFPPSKVVFGGGSFLTSEREKLELLQEFEPSAVAVIPFSREYAQTDKSVFQAQLGRLGPEAIIVGEDFRFGHKRQGTLNDLSLVTRKLEVFGLQSRDGEVVKSSSIRELLSSGDVVHARRLLGAPYLVLGTVVEGDRRERQADFPTANLVVPEGKALPQGVFSVLVDSGGVTYRGMAKGGPRPRDVEEPPALEVYLLDFDGDLYGRELRVRFIDRIRETRGSGDGDDPERQLEADARLALRQLASYGGE